MSNLSGINHLDAVRALQKVGFYVVRQSKHIVMRDADGRFLTIPRNNPIKPFTMGGIAKDAGLSIDEFRKLL